MSVRNINGDLTRLASPNTITDKDPKEQKLFITAIQLLDIAAL